MIIVITFQSKSSFSWALSNLVLSRSVLIISETSKRQTTGCEVKYRKLGGWWEEEERWGILPFSCSWKPFKSTFRSSMVLLWLPILWATSLPWISVSLLWKPAKDTLLTTCSFSYTRQLPRLIFFAFSSCWFMAFPYVAIKLLESPLRDELMPLKYISVSCPLMVLFKNKGGVGAVWFLLKFSFPLL